MSSAFKKYFFLIFFEFGMTKVLKRLISRLFDVGRPINF
ncbi:hypothetical protein STRDD11_02513 [Streptococcus sp. DD11]|nr:hypothetical protein STRDD11_02513 [Streptococcus sp. DD11]